MRRKSFLALEGDVRYDSQIKFTDIEVITTDTTIVSSDEVEILICYFDNSDSIGISSDDRSIKINTCKDCTVIKSLTKDNISTKELIRDSIIYHTGISSSSVESIIESTYNIEDLTVGMVHRSIANRLGYSKLENDNNLFKEINIVISKYKNTAIDISNLSKFKHELIYILRSYNIEAYPILIGDCVTHSCDIDFKLKDKDIVINYPKTTVVSEDNVGYCYFDNYGLAKDILKW